LQVSNCVARVTDDAGGSPAKVAPHLLGLLRCESPAGVLDTLPSLVPEPLTDRAVADAELFGELARGHGAAHVDLRAG
jgi:hypothetical protein